MLHPTPTEQDQRNQVISTLISYTQKNQLIGLPRYKEGESVSAHYALQTIALQQNPFGGSIGDYLYQFEGEEDLLHLMITRRDESLIEVNEAREVASFLLKGMPWALIWLRPGEYSQHFYFGHDDLVNNIYN